jgi:polysaccharide biosynthesis protein PelF
MKPRRETDQLLRLTKRKRTVTQTELSTKLEQAILNPEIEQSAVASLHSDNTSVAPVSTVSETQEIIDVEISDENNSENDNDGEGSSTAVLQFIARPETAVVSGNATAQPDEVETTSTSASNSEPLKVLLITEGTYPFHWGGVSTWCHLLIRDLPEVNFCVYSIVADPQVEPKLNMLPNVVEFHRIPLWGTLEVLELQQNLGMGELLQRRQTTTEAVIEAEFVPAFRSFISELYLSDSNPAQLGTYLHAMYRFFLTYDFDTVFHSQALWNCYVTAMQQDFPRATLQHGYPDIEFTLQDITTGLQWLYHWLFPLAKPIPRVDIAHASTAGISTIIGVIAQREYGAAFLLSEHGIYLRERYLAEADAANSFFLKLLALRFARRMTDLNYVTSEQISPCCDYNQRWELQNGAPHDRLRTIYYGADADKFYAGDKPLGEPPVVVWVGRISPIKDLLTLLKAAGLVHQVRPDIQFKLFGNPAPQDQPYYEECLALREKLGLEETVIFAGYASNAAIAYNEGDVVLLSSISEGFPFATLEAMLCGKAVVATAVGGLPEQIEGCGIVVEPRNPKEMADAVLTLMNDLELCATYGKAAREKALQEFSVHQSREAYLSSYFHVIQRRQTETLFAAEAKLLSEVAECESESDEVLYAVAGNGTSGILTSSKERSAYTVVKNSPVLEEVLVAHKSAVVNYGAATSDHKVLGWKGNETVVVNHNTNYQAVHSPDAQDTRHISKLRRRLLLLTMSKKLSWEPRNQVGLRTLAEDVMRHDSQPVDYLEVAALLESMGTTDEMATEQYGAPDVFELAKVVLDIIRAEPPLVKAEQETPPKASQNPRQALANYAQGPIALLPGILVLLIIQFYGSFGQWSGGQMTALSLGMSAGLLLTNGFLQAVMRRASISISMGNPRTASKFLLRALAVIGIIISGLAILALLVTAWIGGFTFEERVTFCLAFLSLSAIWLVGGPLTLVEKQVWLGIGLLAGMTSGLATNFLTALFSDLHLLFGTIIGFGITLAVIIYAERRIFAALSKDIKGEKVILPARAYLLYEATPYFVYGMLYVAFISIPHFLGWFGKLNDDYTRQSAIMSLEAGLTLALPPLVLVGGFAERTLRLFWYNTPSAQGSTSGLEVEQFGQKMLSFYYRQRWRYSIVLVIIGAIFGIPFWFMLNNGTFTSWIGSNSANAVVFFLVALVSYGWLGLGLFNCMFCVTLARPLLAVRAISVGTGVMLAVGLPLSLNVDFKYSLIAFAIGAVAFVIASSRLTEQMLTAADYYYASAF